MSLDVFRGATIASMILVNNPGSSNAIYPPLEHAEWNGWTFTDTVFPFFLWIVGVAMTLSFARRVESGHGRAKLFLHTVRRAAVIFGLGLFLSGFPYFRLSSIRIPGVLQRIAVCYLIAAIVFLTTRWRTQVFITVALLAAYWLMMAFGPVPGYGPGHLEKEMNFVRYVDNLVLAGHMWSQTKTWDPEGIVSTIPAIATTLFGILAGHILRLHREPSEKTVWLLLSGNCLLCIGLIMSIWLPINKNLWTSSYSVFMAGLASIVLAGWYWIVDVKNHRAWAKPFAIYGMNAITVFVLSGVIGRMLGIIKVLGPDGRRITLEAWVFNNVFAPFASPINASLLYAIATVIFFYLIAWFMYRRRWFIRF